MRNKKVGSDSPEIIVTFKFETATSVEKFARYVDYSDRESAILIDHVEEAFENHLEISSDFEKMVSYMKRDAAVVNKDERRTGLFNETSNNLSVNEMEELKEKLNEAQLLGNNLWNPVVSFDVSYMIRVGILKYNPELEANIDRLDKVFKAAEKEKPKNPKKIYQAKKALELEAKKRVVNQDKLKAAVQANMGKFLKSEGFDENTFWWGSVHLNTKHIHIHLSFSETKTSRKMLEVQKEINGKIITLKEPRGKLKEKNIARFKSNLFHFLEIDEEKELKILKEVEVGKHRQAILEQVTDVYDSTLLNFYLEETVRRFPKEGKLNYSSNRKDFRESKAYLTAFVEEYVRTIGKSEYEAFTRATREQLEDYRHVYSKKEQFDLEKLVEKRQKTLKAALANRMLKELKNYSLNQAEAITSDFLNSKELEQVVEDLKQTKISSKELGRYKGLVERSYAEAEEQYFRRKLRGLDHFEDMGSNVDLKIFSKRKFEQHVQLAQLKQMSSRDLSEFEKEKKKRLKSEVETARQLSIDQASNQRIEKRFQKLAEEEQLIKKTRDKALIQFIYDTDQKEALAFIGKEKKILQIKNKIYHNNLSKNKKDNIPLLKELKTIYGEEKSEKLFKKKIKQFSKQKIKLKRPQKSRRFYRKNKKYIKKRLLPRFKTKCSFKKALRNGHEAFQSMTSLSNNELKRAQQKKRQSDEEEEKGR
ncbi:relaxase MobL [Lactococcus lactis]|uniref:relaxase MobL n=1 Tax=Lactococcus lactis TaxID=1358 RepID=UPI0022262662|nr:relaxase MobL [Lactococcus lactis]